MFDIVIIGAGVVGSAIARQLSKYDLKICVLEKEADVSLGASKANSGIVHGGYAGKYGTLKGQLCIKGNAMYDQLNQELNFGFKRCGGMILGFNEDDKKRLEELIDNGKKVGQNDFIWLDREALREKEPHINEKADFALFMPSIGVTSPYEMTIALIENAIQNGVELKLKHEVQNISWLGHYQIETNQDVIKSKWIINAAGIHSGKINDIFDDSLVIHPRRGQYVLFGKDQGELVNHVIFQPPTDLGKGILVTTTYHGNFMIGPDAEDLMDDINTETSINRLKSVIKTARKSIPNFDLKRALTTFSGIRAISHNKDFFIKEIKPNFITVGGIDSPGLTAAPAISEYVLKIIQKSEVLNEKNFNPFRESYYQEDDSQVICLCEEKTENMILKAINGPIYIDSTDAVKRRVRAGMGICQGRRCQTRVASIIREKNNLSHVRKRTEINEPDRVPISQIRKIQEDD